MAKLWQGYGKNFWAYPDTMSVGQGSYYGPCEGKLTDKLYKLVESFPVVVISGARQVGKSTLLQSTLGIETEIVVFDPVIDIENTRQDPELFLNNHPLL